MTADPEVIEHARDRIDAILCDLEADVINHQGKGLPAYVRRQSRRIRRLLETIDPEGLWKGGEE